MFACIQHTCNGASVVCVREGGRCDSQTGKKASIKNFTCTHTYICTSVHCVPCTYCSICTHYTVQSVHCVPCTCVYYIPYTSSTLLSMYVHTYVHMYVCTSVRTYIHLYLHMYICTYICTSEHTYCTTRTPSTCTVHVMVWVLSCHHNPPSNLSSLHFHKLSSTLY